MAKFSIPENCSAYVPMILKEFCSSKINGLVMKNFFREIVTCLLKDLTPGIPQIVMGDFSVDLLSKKDDVITRTFSAFEQNIKLLYIYIYTSFSKGYYTRVFANNCVHLK
jgi:hypothetical protein